MLSLSEDNQYDVIEAFNSTSRYLDDLLNIDNNFFDSMVNRIYPSELQLNKANVSDAEASFLDLHLSISDGFVKIKIYDKRDDVDFDIVNFPFLDGDVPRSASYGVYGGSRKKPPLTSSIVQIINFQSFEIRGYILNNQKISIGLDSCFRPSFLILWVTFDTIQSLNRLPYQI